MSHDFDIEAFEGRLTRPSESAADAARHRQRLLTKPTGALGRLEEISIWVCAVQDACPPRDFRRPRVVIFAGDHGIARSASTSAYPPEVTAQMVLNFVRGGAAVNVLANRLNVGVRVVDIAVDVESYSVLDPATPVPADVTAHKIRRGSGSIDREDASTRDEALAAFAAGVAIADEEIDSGADLLIPGDMGIGNTTVAAALTAVMTGVDIPDVVGRGTGIDDDAWMRKAAAVRDAARRGRPVAGDIVDLVACVGSADIAAMAGFLAQSAARRTPVILDGVMSCVAALIVQRFAFAATEWFIAGHRSTEPSQAIALQRLGLEPLVDYQLRLGEGTGALIALPIIVAAADTLRDMATFSEAGVTDREPADAGASAALDAT